VAAGAAQISRATSEARKGFIAADVGIRAAAH
jgi:hypothetical protein